MTIEEAIQHAEEVMIENLDKTEGRKSDDPVAVSCARCADEHRQLAEWLRDYQRLQKAIENIKTEITEQVLESLSDGGDDWFTAEKVNECLDIIDKHTSGGE